MTVAVRASVIAVTSAFLACCASSAPMRFYTLSSMGNDAATTDVSSGIRVVRVSLPGEIDRSELVRRVDSNRLQLAEDDRWAAPLDEMIRRVLSENLRSRIPAASGDPERLSLEIEEFIADADCTVTLRAAWSLESATPAVPPTRGYETVRTETGGVCEVGALPAAMSRALAELSTRIAAARAAHR